MGWPQVLVIVMCALRVAFALLLNGKPVPTSAGLVLIQTALLLGALYAAGFFA